MKDKPLQLRFLGYQFSAYKLAIVALIVVSAGYTFLSIAARLLSQGFQPLTQVYLRVGLGFIIAIFLLRKNIRWHKIRSTPKKDWVPLLLMGIVGYALFVYFVTLGALHAKLINVAVLLGTVPFFSYIYSFIIFKKPLKISQILLILISFVGVAIVSTKSFIPIFSEFGKGELYILISATLLSWFFIGRKMLSPHLNNSEITISVMFIACITTFVLAIFSHEPFSITSFANWSVVVGLVMGAMLNIISNLLETFAFQYLDITLGSQILLLENIFALLFGFIFYNEIISHIEIVGSLFILGSVYIANKINKS